MKTVSIKVNMHYSKDIASAALLSTYLLYIRALVADIEALRLSRM